VAHPTPNTAWTADATSCRLVEGHLDTAALEHVIGHGAPAELPVVTSRLAGSPG